MKRWIAYILLSSIIISNTELHEVMMLPGLYTHFNQHNSGEKSMSFLDFIQSHYIGDDTDHADNSDERKMPFKGHYSTVSIAFFNKIVDNFVFIDTPKTMVVPVEGNYLIVSSYLNNIWQPPKFC